MLNHVKNLAQPVIIRGGGDLASGVAHRLFNAGLNIVILELPQPMAIRRLVSFSEAVYENEWTVEGVTSRLMEEPETLPGIQWKFIPMIVDPYGQSIAKLNPKIIVDARMAKQKTETQINDAPLVIGLGPGFTAGKDVHFVIETHRGKTLGKIIENGQALPDTGIPGELGGESARRIIRSPISGVFTSKLTIGSHISKETTIGTVNNIIAKTTITGTLRGLLRNGLAIAKNTKIADVDPRPCINASTISDKAKTIANSVLNLVT